MLVQNGTHNKNIQRRRWRRITPRIKISPAECSLPVMKFEPVFYESVFQLENRSGDVRDKINQQKKQSDSRK